MNYTAFIPARSGSKRLPHKNIKELAGKPLLAWTLEACNKVDKINKIILSTDSEEYWSIAQQYISTDKLQLDFRNTEEAADNIKIFDYLRDKRSKIFSNFTGAFILALPTVPLRQPAHINDAIDIFERNKKPVFSATNYSFPISFAFTENSETGWSPLSPDSPMKTGNTRSQNQQVAYHPNGAIYIRDLNDLSTPTLNTLYDGAIPYIMDRDTSIDIDSEIDFDIAETLARTRFF